MMKQPDGAPLRSGHPLPVAAIGSLRPLVCCVCVSCARRGGRYPVGAPAGAVGLAGRLPCDARSEVAPGNSLRSLRSLRSDTPGESDVEARALRAPTSETALLGAPKSPPPGTALRAATLVVCLDEYLGASCTPARGFASLHTK